MDSKMRNIKKSQIKQWPVFLLSLALVLAFTGELGFWFRMAMLCLHCVFFFVCTIIQRRIPWFVALFFLLSVLFFAIKKESLLGAFILIKNANLMLLSYVQGQIHTTMVVPDFAYVGLFLLWMNLINIFVFIRRKQFNVLLLVMILVMNLSLIYFLGKQILAISLLLISYNLFFEKKSNQKVLYILPGLLLVIVALMGARSYHEPTLFEQKVNEQVERICYGTNEEFLLPDGRFTLLEPGNRLPKEVLEVVLSKNQNYYLRGYTGATYQGKSFLPDRYYAKEEIQYLSRLQSNGFQPQSQLALASEAVQKNVMQIKNTGASTKYKYIPYELITDGKGEDYTNYQLQVTDYQLANVYTILERLKEDPKSKYLKEESYYNRYVYEKYRQIPKSTENYLRGVLKEASQSDVIAKDHADLDIIKQKVIDFFDQNLTYQPKYSRYYGDGDFLEFIIERQAGGIDVHYASLATMMFRYYGIPARYVEGFLITPKDLENAIDGQKISLNGSHAHAWVEVYEDGIGWIPFESTPPYYATMPQASPLVSTTAQSYRAPIVLPEEASKILEEENYHRDQKTLQERQAFINRMAMIMGAITIVLLLVLLGIALHQVYYHRKLNRAFYERASAAQNRISTLELGQRMIWFMKEQQQGTFDLYQHSERKEDWQEIYTEARFSEHDITNEQRSVLVDSFKKSLEMFERSLNTTKRVKMRLYGYLKRF